MSKCRQPIVHTSLNIYIFKCTLLSSCLFNIIIIISLATKMVSLKSWVYFSSISVSSTWVNCLIILSLLTKMTSYSPSQNFRDKKLIMILKKKNPDSICRTQQTWIHLCQKRKKMLIDLKKVYAPTTIHLLSWSNLSTYLFIYNNSPRVRISCIYNEIIQQLQRLCWIKFITIQCNVISKFYFTWGSTTRNAAIHIQIKHLLGLW